MNPILIKKTICTNHLKDSCTPIHTPLHTFRHSRTFSQLSHTLTHSHNPLTSLQHIHAVLILSETHNVQCIYVFINSQNTNTPDLLSKFHSLSVAESTRSYVTYHSGLEHAISISLVPNYHFCINLSFFTWCQVTWFYIVRKWHRLLIISLSLSNSLLIKSEI